MQKSHLLCIGHRGATGHEPENTLASIHKAIELGAPCVEVDVYSVDGHLVVFHDDLEAVTSHVADHHAGQHTRQQDSLHHVHLAVLSD